MYDVRSSSHQHRISTIRSLKIVEILPHISTWVVDRVCVFVCLCVTDDVLLLWIFSLFFFLFAVSAPIISYTRIYTRAVSEIQFRNYGFKMMSFLWKELSSISWSWATPLKMMHKKNVCIFFRFNSKFNENEK